MTGDNRRKPSDWQDADSEMHSDSECLRVSIQAVAGMDMETPNDE
jgi:hypothetical protein